VQKVDHTYQVESTKEVFHGRVFTLVNKEIRFPDGHLSTFNVIEHPGACAILPRFANGDVLLLRQLRVATGETLYEIPAGTIERGESALKTGQREIVEETGYRAKKWKKLAEFYPAPGFCSELMRLFLATDLHPAKAHLDADEVLEPVRVSFRKALRMIREGEIRDAKTIAGLLLVRK
jgi:ADP-ribose pyrophosphatase